MQALSSLLSLFAISLINLGIQEHIVSIYLLFDIRINLKSHLWHKKVSFCHLSATL